MEIERKPAYVVLDGTLDFTTKGRVANALPDPATLRSAVINCTHATYIDSMILGMLVQFRRKFVESGGDPQELVLMLPSDGPVRRMFEITGLTRLFPMAAVTERNHHGEVPPPAVETR